MKRQIINMAVASVFALAFCVMSYAADGKDLVKANVPQIYGKSKDAFTGTEQKTIIHIQDAHGNVEAQENIQAIIKTLAEQGKIDAIAQEGAWWEANVDSFKEIDNIEGATEAVTDFWTKYCIVTGAERYKILDNRDMPVVGNEDPNVKLECSQLGRDARSNKKDSAAMAEKIKGSMEALKLKLYDEATRNFLQALEDFQQDRITLTAYSKVLKENADSAQVKWNTFNNFSKVVESVTLEDAIDFAKIDRERLDMVDELETKVDKKVTDEIVNKSLNYRLGRLSAAEYYDFLLSQSGSAKLDMTKYANVEKYAKLVKLYAAINDDELFAETERLENEIKSKIFKTDAQVSFDKYVKGLDILTKMINLQMTRADLAYYNENKPKAAQTIAFLKEQGKALNVAVQADDSWSKIDSTLASNEKFYDMAKKRDEIMVEKTLAMMDERGFKTVVLVAGGFHTEGIINGLKAKNVSHSVVTPRITNPDAPNYHEQFMNGEDTEASNIISGKVKTIAAITDTTGSGETGKVVTTPVPEVKKPPVQETYNAIRAAGAETAEDVKAMAGLTEDQVTTHLGSALNSENVDADAKEGLAAAQSIFANIFGASAKLQNHAVTVRTVDSLIEDVGYSGSYAFGSNRGIQALRTTNDANTETDIVIPIQVLRDWVKGDAATRAAIEFYLTQLAKNELTEVETGNIKDTNEKNLLLKALSEILAQLEQDAAARGLENIAALRLATLAYFSNNIEEITAQLQIRKAEMMSEEDLSKNMASLLENYGVNLGNLNEADQKAALDLMATIQIIKQKIVFDAATPATAGILRKQSAEATPLNLMYFNENEITYLAGISKLQQQNNAPVLVSSLDGSKEDVVKSQITTQDPSVNPADIVVVKDGLNAVNMADIQKMVADGKIVVICSTEGEKAADAYEILQGKVGKDMKVSHTMHARDHKSIKNKVNIINYNLFPVSVIQAVSIALLDETQREDIAKALISDEVFEGFKAGDEAKLVALFQAYDGKAFTLPAPSSKLTTINAMVEAFIPLAKSA